jgi:hypothetical protein
MHACALVRTARHRAGCTSHRCWPCSRTTPRRHIDAKQAMKIATTLFDGHLPSCSFPSVDAEWTSLHMDDVKLGEPYFVSRRGRWPQEMRWTDGHVGVVIGLHREIRMALLQFHKDGEEQCWWYTMDEMSRCGNGQVEPRGMVTRDPIGFGHSTSLDEYETLRQSSARILFVEMASRELGPCELSQVLPVVIGHPH